MGNSLGDFSAHYAAYSLAYGRKFTDQLSLGVTGKLIDAKISDVSAKAYAADLGSLYQMNEKIQLAATVTNIGSKLTFTDQGDSLPLAFHLAGAYRPERHWILAFESLCHKTGKVDGRLGLGWEPFEAISLRIGYKTDTTKELSALAGLTLGLGVHLFGQEFAYAWLPYGDLGSTQYFSLHLRFGATDEGHKNISQNQITQP